MDNIPEDAVHCPNCGASLLTPGNWDPNRQAPPQQQYVPPQPPKAARVATVRNVGLTEVLFLLSGFFLVIAGFDNLSVLGNRFFGGQYPLLGILALLAGLFVLAMLIMPSILKSLDNMMDILMLGISVLFLFWGLAANFGNNIGFSGAILIGAGLAGLAGAGLKMGLLK
jgi:hypothetical protein